MHHHFSELREKYRDYTEFYTDASTTNEHVGRAVVSEHWQHGLRLPELASIFTAEVYALLMALEKIVTGDYKKCQACAVHPAQSQRKLDERFDSTT